MTTTEAAVLVGPRTFEVQEFTIPEIGPDEGLLEVESSGICGSDIKPYLHGGAALGFPRTIDVPVILGHEMVGRITRIGARAAERWGVEEGDRVVVERWMPCGQCSACHRGAFAYCVRYLDGKHLFYGGTPTTVRSGLWGGFARHMYLHPDSTVHRVARDTPPSAFTLFLPLANAVDWVHHTGGAELGSRVLIQGPGPIGLMGVMVAKAAGADTIVVTGMPGDEGRLQLARDLGATHTFDASVEDVAARCQDISGGIGMDLVLDVTSAETLAPVATAVSAARASGRIVLATDHSSSEGAAEIFAKVQSRTLTIVGVRGRQRKSAEAALTLLQDPAWVEQMTRLCDPVVALDDVASGFEALLDGRGLHASVSMSKDVAH